MRLGNWLHRAALLALLLLAGALRLYGLAWDGLHHYHPDERYISWVAATIEWPATAEEFLLPRQTTANPFYWPAVETTQGIGSPRDQYRDFAYGHFPIYLGVAATRLVEQVGPALASRLPADWFFTARLLNGAGDIEFNHLTLVGRALTALIDVGSVALIYWLGRRLYDRGIGLLAAAFLTLNVMHIQLSHFFATDPYTTFFTLATLLALVGALDRRRTTVLSRSGLFGRSPLGRQRAARLEAAFDARKRGTRLLLAAVFIGLAVGSKFSAILLFLPLALTVWWWGDGAAPNEATADTAAPWLDRLAVLVTCGVIAFFAFTLTNPFAVLDRTCTVTIGGDSLGPITLPAFEIGSCYLQNVTNQSEMVRGSGRFPFTRQYIGTLPFLYFIEMQLKWGMGWPLGLAAFGGLAWILAWAARQFRRPGRRPLVRPGARPMLVVLAWTIPYFISTGSFLVKFMRYMQPITPLLMLFAAAWLLHWRRPRWRRAAVGATLALTALYALSFVSIYRQPHPWIAASAWIYDNVPAEAMILTETWDEGLPTSLGAGQSRSRYTVERLNWLTNVGEGDNVYRLSENTDLIASADYIIVASNRNYGVLPRLPDFFPLSHTYFPRLFDGSLGYELAYVNFRAPNLLGLHLKPSYFPWAGVAPPPAVADYLRDVPGVTLGRVDESFTVYDQPLVMIFENVARHDTGTLLETILGRPLVDQ